MTNLNQYNHRVSILFNDYIQNLLSLNEFMQKLRAVEDLYGKTIKKDTQENSLWFKFSAEDTLVTIIGDLEKDLSNWNRDFTLERMREAITLDNELFIHYS